MKFLIFIFFMSINAIGNEGVILIGCDEKIELKIDELTMTDEEVIAAKDNHFNKLLAQLNGNCISSIVGSDKTNSSNLNKGGKINGLTSITNSNQLKSSSNLSTPLASTNKTLVKSQPKQQTMLKCLNKYKNDDEFSLQLKEAISKTNDPILKKDLIERFAKYKNIKPESMKC
jgi:hypothetical protein